MRYRLVKGAPACWCRGVGTAFDGLYFVKSVTTTIKHGEIKQSFQLTRNGLVSITPKVPASRQAEPVPDTASAERDAAASPAPIAAMGESFAVSFSADVRDRSFYFQWRLE